MQNISYSLALVQSYHRDFCEKLCYDFKDAGVMTSKMLVILQVRPWCNRKCTLLKQCVVGVKAGALCIGDNNSMSNTSLKLKIFFVIY